MYCKFFKIAQMENWYSHISAPHHLARFFRGFYVADHHGIQTEIVAPPTGYAVLGHIFRGFDGATVEGRQMPAPRMPFNIVAAQLHKKRASVRWAGGMGHLAAEFTATGLWELLHTDARDLSGEAHLLSTLHRRIDSALLDACTTHGPSLAAVQLALGPFTAEARTAPDFVSETVRQIEVSAGQVRLGDLCREMGISPPTLNKWFQQVVGLPPKYFSRVAQFNHLATLILSNDTLSLSLLAAEAGFYDQAHFTRAVREFVIMTPRAFLESDFSNIATFLRQIK